MVVGRAGRDSPPSAPAAAPTEEKLEGKDEPGRIIEPAAELDKLREDDRDPLDREAAEGAPGPSPAVGTVGGGLPR